MGVPSTDPQLGSVRFTAPLALQCQTHAPWFINCIFVAKSVLRLIPTVQPVNPFLVSANLAQPLNAVYRCFLCSPPTVYCWVTVGSAVAEGMRYSRLRSIGDPRRSIKLQPSGGFSTQPLPRTLPPRRGTNIRCPVPPPAETLPAPTGCCVVARRLAYSARRKPYTVPLESVSGTGNG